MLRYGSIFEANWSTSILYKLKMNIEGPKSEFEHIIQTSKIRPSFNIPSPNDNQTHVNQVRDHLNHLKRLSVLSY